MTDRVDTASRLIAASPDAIYAVFVDPEALMQWLPPGNMTGRILHFEPRSGGRYAFELTYTGEGSGKSSARSDIAEGHFVELVPGRRIVQSVEFRSDDPAFAGTMIMTWSLEPRNGGTEVRVTAANVPAGISAEDHAAGMNGSLENLERYFGAR
jgi:uncharacterized protein YndB with AHSA1/START domain